jgi:surface protein
MYGMFMDNTNFNDSGLLDWDVSSVTSMEYMFSNATAFNQPIGNWDLSNITIMNYMFSGASSFNKPIGNWNISSATFASGMFSNATAFDQPIGNWDVSNIKKMDYMFENASSFNQDLTAWNVNSGISTIDSRGLDTEATNFSSNATSFENRLQPFWGRPPLDLTQSIYYPISNSGAANPTSSMTFYPSNLDVITWIPNRGLVAPIDNPITNMSGMFGYENNFNDPDLQYWDTSLVTAMADMFADTPFNQDISNWDVSSVTSMDNMFRSATAFNQDISNWDVSAVTSMHDMFRFASAFNQDLRWWDVSGISSSAAVGFDNDTSSSWTTKPLWGQSLNYYPLSNTASDPTFVGWLPPSGGYRFKPYEGIYTLPGQPITNMSHMFVMNSSFNDPDIGNWDVSSVTNMASTFRLCTYFDQNISGWDVSNVTDMSSMFEEARFFNQDITGWDVSNVTNMRLMFSQIFRFNQDISIWDVSKVTNMRYMFAYHYFFNQDLTRWDVSNVTDHTNFAFNANPSWTLKPREIETYSSTQRIWQSASTSANQTLTRINSTYTIFTSSDIDGISSIDDIFSLQQTGTTFVAPTTNQNDWSAIIKHQYGAPTTEWFTLSNSQQFSDITPYTGDLLPYLRYISSDGTYRLGIEIQTTGSFNGSNYYHQDFDFNMEYTLKYFGESF